MSASEGKGQGVTPAAGGPGPEAEPATEPPADAARPEWKPVRVRRSPTLDPVSLPPVRRHPTPVPLAPAARSAAEEREALIAQLSRPPAEPSDPLADVQAAPGEVPRLHSDAGLQAMWIAIALSLVVAAAFGVWAVFLRQPW